MMINSDEPIMLPTGFKMFTDNLDSLEFRKGGPYYEKQETEFIQSFVKPGMVCVDVGAFIGYYTILMARQGAYIYAFEPGKDNFPILMKNLQLNRLFDSVWAYPRAIGQFAGLTRLYECETNNGMHRIYRSKWCNSHSEKVSIGPLDSVLDHADFIKMDIEGSEFGALLGMKNILKNGCTLLMEFHIPSIQEYGREPIEILDYMHDFDYDISFLDRPARPVTWRSLMDLGERPGMNILCTPRKGTIFSRNLSVNC